MFDTTPQLVCGQRRMSLDRPRIMGILNVTPDSFSDGGRHDQIEAAVAHGLRLLDDGADLLDIGGESTRPGAATVDLATELARVIPVIEGLRGRTELPLSVDTRKPEVMRAALAAGADMVNDVAALRSEGALAVVAESRAALCLMHMQGEPGSMQGDPQYDDVVGEVHRFLAERIFACEMSGISKDRIVIDPGFGFGKTLEHNYQLLAALERFTDLGVPVLAGLSRKSMIGQVTGRAVDQRVVGSVAAALLAAEAGARLLRVHDVAETRDALAVLAATRAQPGARRRALTPPVPAWPDED